MTGWSYRCFEEAIFETFSHENDVLFSNDTGKLGKRNSECSYQESDLSITGSDALPLSYRRLAGAKAIKL